VQYTVLTGPRHGRLSMTGGVSSLGQFSQDDVDNDRVFYEHRGRGQCADSFHFDVSCGSERRPGLEFGVDIVPAMIPLEVTGNLTVPHGGTATLTSSLVRVTGQQLEVRFNRPNCLLLSFDLINDFSRYCYGNSVRLFSTSPYSSPLDSFTLNSKLTFLVNFPP